MKTIEEKLAAICRRVDADIEQARRGGENYTPYRAMLPLENIGAYFCGSSSYTRRSQRHLAKYVSYATFAPWRFVVCEQCFAEMG